MLIRKIADKISLFLEKNFPAVFDVLFRNRVLVKYAISGFVAAFTDLFSLYFITEYILSPNLYLLGVAIAFIFAFMASFFLQKFWTFKNSSMEKIGGEVYLYFLVALLNLGLNLFVIFILVEAFDLWYFYAQLVSALFLGGISFVLYNRYVFRNSMMVKGSIMLATGIFPPDVGGPAVHTLNFLKGLNDADLKTGVVAYSDVKFYEDIDNNYEVERVSRKIPYGIRHLIYFVRLFVASLKYEIIYAQDISAAGLPAVAVSKLIKRRFFIRIGGDLLWERLAEKGKTKLSVINFYEKEKYKKYYLYHIGESVLKRAEKIIVPTELLAGVYKKYYGIPEKNIIVLPNPLPFVPENHSIQREIVSEKKILFAGRFVKYKNLEKLIIAFANIYNEIGPAKLVLIGDGPEKRQLVRLVKRLNLRNQILFETQLPHDELMEEIKKASLCVGPALTEFNPNFILECLSLEKPVILTKENGLSIKLPEKYLLDADDLKDIENKLKNIFLLNGKQDDELVLAIRNSHAINWSDIIKKHVSLFKDNTSH